MKKVIIYLLTAFLMIIISCGNKEFENEVKIQKEKIMSDLNLDTATFAAGCFWCVEAVFAELEGVQRVVSGYTGGKVDNPTYEMVCSGKTGHAEACRIIYDPGKISFEKLLEVFWQTHDPTTLNRQGNDVGTQYRSAIYYNNDVQKGIAESIKNKLNSEGAFDKPIVTEITQASVFYNAEDYHQEYYKNNSNQGYCVFVVKPKLDKLKKVFRDILKEK